MDPALIGIGTSLLGGILGGNQAAAAQRQAEAAQRDQGRLIDRQVDGYDSFRNAIQDAIRQGLFDPNTGIAQMEADSARYQKTELGNLSGALRNLGYRAGDSEGKVQLDASMERGRADLESRRFGYRQQRLGSLLGQYQSLNAGGQALNTGIGAYGAQQSIALGQQQQANAALGSLLGSSMPFLASQQRQRDMPVPPIVNYGGFGGGSGQFGNLDQFGSGGMSGFGGGSGQFGDLDQFGTRQAFNKVGG